MAVPWIVVSSQRRCSDSCSQAETEQQSRARERVQMRLGVSLRDDGTRDERTVGRGDVGRKTVQNKRIFILPLSTPLPFGPHGTPKPLGCGGKWSKPLGFFLWLHVILRESRVCVCVHIF